MGLRTNTYESVTDCIKNESGYSLKKRKLQQWIYRNHLTQPYMARRLKLEPDEFKQMIKGNVPFNREQITLLVRFMGARVAFNVIYFPTLNQRRKVYRTVFGNYKERKNE